MQFLVGSPDLLDTFRCLLEEDTDKAVAAGLVVVAALAFVCLYKIKST